METMSICDTYDTPIPNTNLTLESRVYEDGYFQVSLVDEFGYELDSLDGNARDGEVDSARVIAEERLVSQYFDE